MDGQNKLTAYTIHTHHVTHMPTNLLKSKQFSIAIKRIQWRCSNNMINYSRHPHDD